MELIQTESRAGVTRAWEEGKGELVFLGDRVAVLQGDKGSAGCTAV